MPRPQPPPTLTGMDSRVEAYVRAEDGAIADQELAKLIRGAEPVIIQTLQRHSGRGHYSDLEDAASEARLALISRLRRLRECDRDSRESIAVIADLDAYIAAISYTAWAGLARQRHPRRAALLNRLQYLLENRTNQQGFALWMTTDGVRWAGFEVWRDQLPQAEALRRLGQLAADPRAVSRGIFGNGHAPESINLVPLVAGLLTWLGGPLRLKDLTDAIAELQGIPQPHEPLPSEHHANDSFSHALLDPRPTPDDEARWREYMAWLWDETARLTLRQRTAFLLHATCLQELELLGMTSVRAAAARLEVPAEDLAAIWNRLPLEDRAIAARLKIEIQQVINLRRLARDSLGRAWRKWLNEK